MTYEEFTRLYDALGEVLDLIDASPDRHETTAKGILADVDYGTLRAAKSTLHRYGLWVKYRVVSPESYLPVPVEAA
jgi:hypothetical protein